MKVPISQRLLSCASMVRQGDVVADIGCDHGYLGIWLLKEGIASHVVACDLREKPLEKAKSNSRMFGTADRMSFHVADGLQAIGPSQVNTVVCAGIGGDCIAHILSQAEWVRNRDCRLILQPQTSGNDLRRYLGDNGFDIQREELSQDGGYLYFTIQAAFGSGKPLSPGEQYVSRPLLQCGSSLLPAYFDRVQKALERTVDGICQSSDPQKQKRLSYYQCALNEVREMRFRYDSSDHN